jgi:hypothetical protein
VTLKRKEQIRKDGRDEENYEEKERTYRRMGRTERKGRMRRKDGKGKKYGERTEDAGKEEKKALKLE